MANTDGQKAFVSAVLKSVRLRLRAAIAVAIDDDSPVFEEREQDEARIRGLADYCVGTDAELPLSWLRNRLMLTDSEELVLWILLANEIDPVSRQLLRDLNTETTADPTLDALRRAVYHRHDLASACAELAPEGRLRHMGLVHRCDAAANAPEHRQTFALARRVLMLATGSSQLDPSLSTFVSVPPRAPPAKALVASQEAIGRVTDALSASDGVVLLSGRPGLGRRSLLLSLAAEHRIDVFQVDARNIATDRATAARQLRDLDRECRLLRRIPLLCHLEALEAHGEASDRLSLVEAELSGLVLATATRPPCRQWARTPTLVELTAPTVAMRTELWREALPEASAGDLEVLTSMYPLAPALIVAAGHAIHRRAGAGEITATSVSAGVRSVLDDRLAGLATRVEVSQTWDDVVLPADQEASLIELLARIRQRPKVYETWGFGRKVGRGLGVAALFSGPPGTGKTMVAGLIANDLGSELYQVDLSKIVSKWIGETERNLANLFDAAEAGHAILLFDEADSLFGKRTEVKSSNDRYANQEVNFLLQRLETFTGVCLLTTNHEASIDEAFRRRLSIHVRFPVPDVDERRHLWRALMPKDAPRAADLDLQSLAQTFAMSGGYIRNAMLRAAFLAADGNTVIDTHLLTRAAQSEYEAMGKIVASLPSR